MILPAGFILGAIWGALLARRRGGKLPDILQYAMVAGILGAVGGLALALLVRAVA